MIPCAVGLDTPVPPYVEFRRPPRVNVAEAPEVVRPVEPPTTFIFPELTVAVPESPVMVASDPEVVAKVPDVGKVTLVVPVNVNVAPKAPTVVNAPAVVKAPPKDRANAPHDGAADNPDNRGRFAVAVLAKMANAVAVE